MYVGVYDIENNENWNDEEYKRIFQQKNSWSGEYHIILESTDSPWHHISYGYYII